MSNVVNVGISNSQITAWHVGLTSVIGFYVFFWVYFADSDDLYFVLFLN